MITLSKIAKLANVSVSTASKAFSMSSEVNEETRENIFNIAKKHGCFKKFFNAKYPKLVVAVICPEFESLYYASILARLQILLDKRGCEICVATTQFSKKRGMELVSYYSKYARVDGIIILDGASALEEPSDLPIVCTGKTNDYAISVNVNSRTALEEAIHYFIRHGVEEIGFIGEWHTNTKLDAFTNIMTDKLGGINPDFVRVGDRFADGAYATTKKMIDDGKVPRALICAYDYLAIGAMRCLTENGYKIPDDVAVIGMDDIPEAKFLNPPLSSIDSNTTDVCEAIADTLLNMMMGKPYNRKTVIDATLKLRKSSEIGEIND